MLRILYVDANSISQKLCFRSNSNIFDNNSDIDFSW